MDLLSIIFEVFFLLLLFGCLVLLIVFHFKKKKNNLWSLQDNLDNKNSDYQNLKIRLDELSNKYEKLLNDKLDPKNFKDYKEIVNNYLSEYFKLTYYQKEFDKNLINQEAQQIILNAIENNALKVANETSTYLVEINEDAKGKFIGKKGQNINYFKEKTKTYVAIEDNKPYISIFCPNSIRRHLAVNTLKHMIKSKAFDKKAIDNIYKKEEVLLEKSFYEKGKDYINNKLHFTKIKPEIYKYVGRLYYRTSYSQNVLEHCYECAILAYKFAEQLSLDPIKAKMCAFFHDIGKANDQEDGSFKHINSGVAIATECELPYYVINVIKNHHGKYHKDPYVVLTRIVDAISAGTVGARTIKQDIYAKAKIIKELCYDCSHHVHDVSTVLGNNFVNVVVTKKRSSNIENDKLIAELQEKISKNKDLQNLKIDFTIQ